MFSVKHIHGDNKKEVQTGKITFWNSTILKNDKGFDSLHRTYTYVTKTSKTNLSPITHNESKSFRKPLAEAGFFFIYREGMRGTFFFFFW